jgi:hypothetical protein
MSDMLSLAVTYDKLKSIGHFYWKASAGHFARALFFHTDLP